MKKKTVNYWTWKDSELMASLEKRGLNVGEDYSRKEVINLLKESDKTAAEQVEETEEYIDKMKKADPTMETVKIIFHSAGEQDLNYVPIGHNGRCFYVKKDEVVEFPKYLLTSVVKDAVEWRLIQQVINGEIIDTWKPVQRFPYSVVEW